MMNEIRDLRNGVHNTKYILMLIVVTVITLAVASVLWNSESAQTLNPNNGNPCDGWCRGPENASVTLDTYLDFT